MEINVDKCELISYNSEDQIFRRIKQSNLKYSQNLKIFWKKYRQQWKYRGYNPKKKL